MSEGAPAVVPGATVRGRMMVSSYAISEFVPGISPATTPPAPSALSSSVASAPPAVAVCPAEYEYAGATW